MKFDIRALIPEVDLLKDSDLKQQVIGIWEKALEIGRWENPHDIPFNATLGSVPSLISHTGSVIRTARWYAQNYEKTFGEEIDYDVLVAGALLHDVAKAIEFSPSSDGPVKSEIGKKLPHGTYSGFLAWEANIPLEILHLIVTHSPSVEMRPNTLEGYILKYADIMDADAHYFCAGKPTILERYMR